MRTNVLNVTPRPMEDGMQEGLEEKRRTLTDFVASLKEEELEAFIAFAVAEWEDRHSSCEEKSGA